MNFLRGVLGAAVLLLCGCGSPGTAAEVIEDHVNDSGFSFFECGAVTTDQCGMWTPTADDQTVLDCLVAGFATCQPARAEVTTPTIEGAPLVSTYFVVPDGKGGCDVDYFADLADDPFAPPFELSLQRCSSLSLSSTCGWISVWGCSVVESWDLVSP